MSATQRTVSACWLTFHFLLIGLVSLRDMAVILPGSRNVLPSIFALLCRQVGKTTATALGDGLSSSNLYRQAIQTYANCAGIEAGYSYFAPSVPGNIKLVFELHYPDGHFEYDLPRVTSNSAGDRLGALLDNFERLPYPRMQEEIMGALVSSAWQRHPDANAVRAIVGEVTLPTATEFRKGERKSFRKLAAYDFSRKAERSP